MVAELGALIIDSNRGRAKRVGAQLADLGLRVEQGAPGLGDDFEPTYVLWGHESLDALFLCDAAAYRRRGKLSPWVCLSGHVESQILKQWLEQDPDAAGEPLSEVQWLRLCQTGCLGVPHEEFAEAVKLSFGADGSLWVPRSEHVSIRGTDGWSAIDVGLLRTAATVAAQVEVPTFCPLFERKECVTVAPIRVVGEGNVEGLLAVFRDGLWIPSQAQRDAMRSFGRRVGRELSFQPVEKGPTGQDSLSPRSKFTPDSLLFALRGTATDVDLAAETDNDHVDVPTMASAEFELPQGGLVLGDTYRVLYRISRGAMGTVYCGEDVKLRRPVAIKVLKPELVSDTKLVSRFRAEARILASLRHPNLVHIYSFGAENGVVYFIMELVDGMPVSDLIVRSAQANEQIDQGVVAAVAEEIADALDEIHNVGVIHRDVKPANILLDQVRGRAVLVDVGVAKRFEETGDAAGTPGFAAPESFVEGGQETPETDVYGLAATVYTMLTGAPPFQGRRLSEVLQYQLHSRPVAPSRLRSALSRGVDDVLLRALDPEPSARYRSAMAFAIALSKSLARDPGADLPVDLLDCDTRQMSEDEK